MKKLFFSGVLALCTMVAAVAAQGEWLTDLDTAKAKAKEANKHVLIDFTGSDWCPPCKQLHANVLTSKEFAEFAKENLILVELDFPMKKEQSAKLKAKNKGLAAHYKIEGYPTIVMLDPSGKEINREVGYQPSTKAADYVAMLKGWIAKK